VPAIFISYRRSDSSDVAGRIYDHLVEKYSRECVFKDVDSIPLGVPFPQRLEDLIAKSDVMVAVIGPNWLNAVDENGSRRLDAPKDYVRAELETALKLRVPVIPLLVSNSSMPQATDLPQAIRFLTDQNGMSVRADPDFGNDMRRLLVGIDRLHNVSRGRDSATETFISKRILARRKAWVAIAVTLLLGLAASYLAWTWAHPAQKWVV
jgi:hypothetical protein